MGLFDTEKILIKDFGTATSTWYCGVRDCKSVYDSNELINDDAFDEIMWGKLTVDSMGITPMCNVHGTFLVFMEEEDHDNKELLL